MKQVFISLFICLQTYAVCAQNEYPTEENSYIRMYGGGISLYSPVTSSGWARGLNFHIHSTPNERVLGLGMHGGGETPIRFYLAYGQSPWANGRGLYILPEGSIGIGTVSPDERLSVNGRIRAKEVKVEAVNWPDYVFDADYQLTTLSELAIFIRKNGHLPGIPKAVDVQETGIALGEMNRRLLEKVEELTLYLIEQEEKMDAMYERLRQIEQQRGRHAIW